MKREKTKVISNWNELVEFVENINPNRETIVLTGWLNELYNERTYIRKLYFTTKDVHILQEKVKKNGTKNINSKLASKNKRK